MSNNYFGFTPTGAQFSNQTPSYQSSTTAQPSYSIQHSGGQQYSAPTRPAVQSTYEASATSYPPPNHQSTAYNYSAPSVPAVRPQANYDSKGYYTAPSQGGTQQTYQASETHYPAATKTNTYTNYTSRANQKASAGTTQPAASTGGYVYNSTSTNYNSSSYNLGYNNQTAAASTEYRSFMPQQGTATSAISTISKVGATGNNWYGTKRTFNKVQRPKLPPKPLQLHYCETCRISCAGPQTYKEHLEGQRHKKKELAAKQQTATTTPAPTTRGSAVALRCNLCVVTCTGNDAYSAHLRGVKHQKVLKLHQALGKPIPADDEPVVLSTGSKAEKKSPVKTNAAATTTPASGTTTTTPVKTEVVAKTEEKDDVQPVGLDYIEEIKNDDGKVTSFQCKLCDCKFNDPNAKEMHMKGRRHRLQYKKKVNPELVVDVKPSLRHRKMQEERNRRHQDDLWKRNSDGGDKDRAFWDERQIYDDPRRMGPPMHMHPTRNYQMMGPMAHRKPDSLDDKHILAKHTQIYPKEEELTLIQTHVTAVEKALKAVSDAIPGNEPPTIADEAEGSQNGDCRILKGIMRVGILAKGLLLTGDSQVELAIMATVKPTFSLLQKVSNLLGEQLKNSGEDTKYIVKLQKEKIIVTDIPDNKVEIVVHLTSPLMRDPNQGSDTPTETPVSVPDPPDVLDRQKCLETLAALRHSKWFQARCSQLPSCVTVIRILRDLCQRLPTWAHLSPWALELLVEKVLHSSTVSLSAGEAFRRVIESIASGLLLPGGFGLMDPCEKDPVDAAANLTAQEREDITASAQHALRLLTFRQLHKVLGMDPLPMPKYSRNPFPRKRRRDLSSGNDAEIENLANGKKNKTDEAPEVAVTK